MISIKAGSCVLIKKYCRYKAAGELFRTNVSLIDFDAADEDFD